MFITGPKDPRGESKARRQAQANADRTRKPWMIFQDAAGNWHAEPFNADAAHPIKAVNPTEEGASSD